MNPLTVSYMLASSSDDQLRGELCRRDDERRKRIKDSGQILHPEMHLNELMKHLIDNTIKDPRTVVIDDVSICLASNKCYLGNGSYLEYKGNTPVLFRYRGVEFIKNWQEAMAGNYPIGPVLASIKNEVDLQV